RMLYPTCIDNNPQAHEAVPRAGQPSSRLPRAQIRGELSDLDVGQVLGTLMHEFIGSKIDGVGLHLLLQIRAVLPGQTRSRSVPSGLCPMTNLTRNDLLCLDALPEDLPARRPAWARRPFADRRSLGS